MTREEMLALVLTAPGGVDALLKSYDTEETAGILGCTTGFLERDRGRMSHQKIGTAVRYDLLDILLIRESCRVEPGRSAPAAPRPAAVAAVSDAPSYRTLTPAAAKGGRQRA